MRSRCLIALFEFAWICGVLCLDKDHSDCSFVYWKTDWKSAASACEADGKQLLCYRSKKEMDDITEAFRLTAFGNAELELWLSGKNCSEPQVMDECLILHIRKKGLKLWHYFRQDCTQKYPFVCCVKENAHSSSTTRVPSTSTEVAAGSSTSTTTTGLDFCRRIRRRGLEWPETPPGEVAVLPCPGNSVGEARWLCKGTQTTRWDELAPNLRDCRSLDVISLREKFNVSSIQQVMSLLTEIFGDPQQEVFGEDLADVIGLMTSLPGRFLAATQFQSISNRWEATRSLVEKSVSLFDGIIELNETWRDIAKGRRPVVGARMLSTVDEMGALLADAMPADVTGRMFEGRNVAMQVLKTRRGESLQLPQWEPITGRRGSVTLDEGFDEGLRPEEGSASVAFALYFDLSGVFPREESQSENDSSGVLNSAVVSATVFQNRIRVAISRPVRILVEHLLPEPNDTACVFWNMQRNEWNTEGCRVEKGNATYTLCVCDHLTNFALLMDYQGVLDDVDQQPFHYVTLVGCVLSIICLAICVLVFSVYSYHSKHAWGLRYVIHRNLCAVLLFANLLLVAGLDRTDRPTACSVIAGLLHYSFLSSFSWMLLEGVHIYLLLVVVFASRRSHWEKYYLFGYGVPLVIVIITVVIRPEYYGTDEICWLSQEKGTIWAFMGPVACILILNVAALVLAQYKATKIPVKDDSTALFKRWLRVTLILFPVLGITWIFGFLYIGQRAAAIGYLFAVLNSLQGFCIFVCHFLMDKKARNFVVSSFKKKSASVTTGSHKSSSADEKSLPARSRRKHLPSLCFDVSEGRERGRVPPPVQWSSSPDGATRKLAA